MTAGMVVLLFPRVPPTAYPCPVFCHTVGAKDWVARVDPEHAIPADALKIGPHAASVSLADVSEDGAGPDSGATLGDGVFGDVATYYYHGAAVAVKKVKAGADEESIGNSQVTMSIFLSARSGAPP